VAHWRNMGQLATEDTEITGMTKPLRVVRLSYKHRRASDPIPPKAVAGTAAMRFERSWPN
jgi:hypothetical protein